jgi:MFS family permease
MNRSIVAMLVATFVLRVSTAVTGVMLVFFVNELTRDTGTGPRDIAFLTGGFYATELVGAIAFGILADRFGRKLIMLLGPIFGAVAVLMTALTTRMNVLFVTRLLEGSSTAASIPSTLGYIAAETADDEELRGKVVSVFELVSLGGMLAVGPALGGVLWEAFGRPAFFLNCGSYLIALLLYAYGVSEVPRAVAAQATAHASRGLGLRRYLGIATSRSVLLFAPTWLAINAILGLWVTQGQLLLTGNIRDPNQFLMQGVSPTTIGIGTSVLAIFFGLGVLFWGLVYARFRRTTLLLWGVAAFGFMAADVFAINHWGGVSTGVLIGLVVALLGAVFVLSGATPAALGLLADVSEEYHQDRSAIMGLYSVFLGLGQVIGALVGGLAASWRGIDGLIVATVVLLLIGLAALLNLRANEASVSPIQARRAGQQAHAPAAPPEPDAGG